MADRLKKYVNSTSDEHAFDFGTGLNNAKIDCAENIMFIAENTDYAAFALGALLGSDWQFLCMCARRTCANCKMGTVYP